VRTRALAPAALAVAAVGIAVGVIATSGGGGSPAGTPPASPAPPGAQPRATTAEAVIYRGTGDETLDVHKPGGDPGAAAILFAQSLTRGASFALTLLGAHGERIDAPIETTGPFTGSVVIDFESQSEGSVTRQVAVSATGPWRVEVRSLSSARRFATRISGSGDEVLAYTGGEGVATIRHAAVPGLFAVDVYTDPDDAYAVVTTTGRFAGRRAIPAGTELVTVRATGPWSISIAPYRA
jgi:hypothetical protein